MQARVVDLNTDVLTSARNHQTICFANNVNWRARVALGSVALATVSSRDRNPWAPKIEMVDEPLTGKIADRIAKNCNELELVTNRLGLCFVANLGQQIPQ